MELVKVNFSIKDLENLSGIKAHTIRIWEQRYKLLQPSRSESNIRSYSIAELQKLMNVKVLLESGKKISAIANFTEDELVMQVNELTTTQDKQTNKYINQFIEAMLSFDIMLFEKTYINCAKVFPFQTIFEEIFIPLLENIGLLWQTNSTQPAHEHFISNLIRQKLFTKIENLQLTAGNDDTLFVLFLPLNEIHDIGLLYLQYEILLRNKKAIYIGPNIELDSLSFFKNNKKEKVVYVTYLTTQPKSSDIKDFIKEGINLLHPKDSFLIGGPKASEINIDNKQVIQLNKVTDIALHL